MDHLDWAEDAGVDGFEFFGGHPEFIVGFVADDFLGKRAA